MLNLYFMLCGLVKAGVCLWRVESHFRALRKEEKDPVLIHLLYIKFKSAQSELNPNLTLHKFLRNSKWRTNEK